MKYLGSIGINCESRGMYLLYKCSLGSVKFDSLPTLRIPVIIDPETQKTAELEFPPSSYLSHNTFSQTYLHFVAQSSDFQLMG